MAAGPVQDRAKTNRRVRPGSEQLFAAAIDLLASGASAFRGTARRYSLCAADADDAYQRGLEILITKAPTDAREELRPWLHTVIKHEALAVRRLRERTMAAAEPDAESRRLESAPGPEEGLAERERVRLTAEALGHLKPSEVQCLLLKALGYSYDEIAARTGFSWTKVNRSLTEGRKRFFEGFEQIESGRRCQRFGPLISAACDGEASREEQLELRSHLRGCASCRAALRSYRSAPARIAELVPPALVLPLAGKAAWWSRLLEPFAGSADRAGALGHKLQQAGEALSAQKAAAVVASTAALAGGAVTTERVTERDAAPSHRAAVEGDGSHDLSRTVSPAPQVVQPAPEPRSQGPDPERGAERAQPGGSTTAATGTEFSPERPGVSGESRSGGAGAQEGVAAVATQAEPPVSNVAGAGFEHGGSPPAGAAPAARGEFGP